MKSLLLFRQHTPKSYAAVSVIKRNSHNRFLSSFVSCQTVPYLKCNIYPFIRVNIYLINQKINQFRSQPIAFGQHPGNIHLLTLVLPFFLFGFKTGHDNCFGILYFQQPFTDLLFLLLVFRERNTTGNKSFIQFPLFFLQFKNLPVKVSLAYGNGIYLTEIR